MKCSSIRLKQMKNILGSLNSCFLLFLLLQNIHQMFLMFSVAMTTVTSRCFSPCALQYYALQILETVIKTRWKILPRNQCEGKPRCPCTNHIYFPKPFLCQQLSLSALQIPA